MTEPIRVMIELRHSKRLYDSAAAVPLMGARDLDRRLVPKLEGISWDEAFAPIDVPGRIDLELPTDPLDVSARYTIDEVPEHATYVLRGTVEEKDREALEKTAEASRNVVGVYADVAIEVCPICPGDPPQGTDKTVERLLCTEALRKCGMDGDGVLVAIVDTGVNTAYLNSRGKSPGFNQAKSWLPATAPPGSIPGQMPVDHGTMCAYDACIAAPKCTLLDIALLQSQRPGGTVMAGFLSDAVLAYRHLLNIMQGPHRPGGQPSLVVNNSWGMFHPSWDYPPGHPGNYSDNPNHPFNRIVGALESAGADILFAAGNCGRDCPDGRCQNVTSNAIYGANSHEQVLCVAGVDVSKDRVGYSTIGPGRLTDKKPDLCGYTHFKGSGVYPADGGTSAATPVVSGIVGALRSKVPFDPSSPSTSPAAVRNMLIKTAEDRGAIGYDYEYGWGVVNGCELERKLCRPEREDKRPCCCCCCCRHGKDTCKCCTHEDGEDGGGEAE